MSRADVVARELLREHGVDRPAIDVYALAASLGVQVIDAKMPRDVSGMLIREAGSLTVGLQQSHRPVRKRFTLAHEIGHLRLHRGRPLIVDSQVRVNLRDSTSARATDREEMEANRFAAALLMPDDLVVQAVQDTDFKTVASLQRLLAERFEVSTEAMGYRLINLGITS